MRDDLRKQIYNTLMLRETEDLLEIWQNGDTSEWDEAVFEIVRQILLERLGDVPPRSMENQILQILDEAEQRLDNNELDEALSECEHAIQIDPDSPVVYNLRGEIYEEMGQLENAIADYQRAVILDLKFKGAWENLRGVEAEIEQQFDRSAAKQRLNRALEYALADEPEKAWEECEAVKSMLPSIAAAHNYLGLIYETLGQLEPAIDAYLKAVQFNPRFYAARENLANARIRLEEEQYFRAANLSAEEIEELSETSAESFEDQSPEPSETENPVPGWFYLDEKAFLLTGWPGHRNRPGRSGYDPLELDFEVSHVEGIIARRLFTGKFRTRNPVYLLLMVFMGLVCCLPLLALAEIIRGNFFFLLLLVFYSPFWLVGIALLINAALSFWPDKSRDYEDNGSAFF